MLHPRVENVTTQIPAAGRRPAVRIAFRNQDNRMISLEKKKSSAMYLTAAVIFACCFAQTAHCLWLRKTERREGRREAKTAGVREGTIVFGRDFEKGVGVTSQVFGGIKTPNASVGDYVIYQADQPGTQLSNFSDYFFFFFLFFITHLIYNIFILPEWVVVDITYFST